MRKTRKTKKQNRWLALALCLCMLASMFPLSGMTYAAGTGCNHTHDENCGYVEAVEGAPCTFTHAHDDTCGYAEAVEVSSCSVEAAHVHDETCGGDPDTGEGCTFAHAHDDACGYAEAKEAAPCSVEAAHIHDENCGYVEAVAGVPCTHVHDADCGGLAQDSGSTACTLTEDTANDGENNRDNSGPVAMEFKDAGEDTPLPPLWLYVYETGKDWVMLAWDAPDPDNPRSADHYKIYQDDTPDAINQDNPVPAGQQHFLVTGLNPDTTYRFRFAGMKGDVEGEKTAPVDARTRPRTGAAISGPNSTEGKVGDTVTFQAEVQNLDSSLYPEYTWQIFREGEDYTGMWEDIPDNNGPELPVFIENKEQDGTKYRVRADIKKKTDIGGSGVQDTLYSKAAALHVVEDGELKVPVSVELYITDENGAPLPEYNGDYYAAAGTALQLDAYVTMDGSLIDGGTVTFFLGGDKIPLGEETLLYGVATFNNFTVENAETYKFAARYNGTASFRSSISPVITVHAGFYAEYHSGDVVVVQGIIDSSSLGWDRDDPGSWNTTAGIDPYLIWDDSTPKRIKELRISSAGLSGTLDVSGLTSLQRLNCSYNNLTGTLDVSGLTSLQHLYCYNNNLTGTLDVSGLTSLQYLYCDNNSLNDLNLSDLTSLQRLDCYDNRLTGLDVTGLTSLQELYCYNNRLTGLDVTGLTSLEYLHCSGNNLKYLDVTGLTGLRYLYCYDNPFQSLKLPYGETLTVNIDPANSGTVMFSHDQSNNLLSNKTVTLTAMPEAGYTFTSWTGGAGGSNADNSFTLSGNMTVTANFHKHNYEGDWPHDDAHHWQLCSCGETGPKTPHSGGTANCHEKAVCEVCSAAYGNLNSDNHDGGTELRNVKAATEEADGYTGDTYCKGCGELLAQGTVIPKLEPSHTHKYKGDWQHDNTDHWQLCSCGEAGPKTSHSGGTANCHEKAVCEVCNAAYGNLNPDNHDGGTKLRDVKAATEEAEGYSGDTYCLGCGELIVKGKAISKTTVPQTGDDALQWPWHC